MRCLVIDDSPDDRALVERILRKSGYKAKCCSSGKEAIGVLGGERFDVALVDMGMPGISGAELLKAMKELDPGMRLLVVSSFDDRHHVLSALDAGADGYVLKPELSENLGAALQEVVGGKSAMSSTVAAILLRHVRGRIQPPPRPAERKKLADASGELIVSGKLQTGTE